MAHKMLKIRREPIQFSPHAIMVVHVFDRTDFLEEVWMTDIDRVHVQDHTMYKEAARQLISQFEGYDCDAFLEAIMHEANNMLGEESE